MTARIEAIRRRTGSALLARRQDYEVAYIMISQPLFFDRDDWIADHAAWHPRIHGGKTIDTRHSDGQRILAECLTRTAHLAPEAQPLVDNPRLHHHWTSKLRRMRADGVVVTPRPLRRRRRRARLDDGEAVEFTVLEEKGIDVRIALDVVRVVLACACDVVLLFSQD
jgi:uncharacterized LabA/DUF88 family protein